MACSVAGITSDANVLTNELRLIAQRSASTRKFVLKLPVIGSNSCSVTGWYAEQAFS